MSARRKENINVGGWQITAGVSVEGWKRRMKREVFRITFALAAAVAANKTFRIILFLAAEKNAILVDFV